MSNNYCEQQQILLKNEYEEIFGIKNERPEWAVKRLDKDEIIHPTIPFVGKNYNTNEKKLLLYASVEKFKDKNKTYNGYLDKKEDAINRCQIWDDSFFPNVHIAPINDGGLVIAVAYILKILEIQYGYNTPRELLENISFANFCKFTIAETDADYPKDFPKLSFSLNYIEKDLEILEPDIIVMPKTIYDKHSKIQKLIKSILPNSLVIPIYQINARNVNLKINKYHPQKNPAAIGILAEWQTHLSKKFNGKTNQNFYAIYSYLEDVIKKLNYRHRKQNLLLTIHKFRRLSKGDASFTSPTISYLKRRLQLKRERGTK